MAKVEVSLPLLAKEGWKNKKIMRLLDKPATQPCPNDKWGNEKNKKFAEMKTKLAQRFWGVGLANHTPKV
jgi:hypothetical protein